MRVKILSASIEKDLEDSINSFLEENHLNGKQVIDIKFIQGVQGKMVKAFNGYNAEPHLFYSAMIIYKQGKPKIPEEQRKKGFTVNNGKL